MLRAVASTQTEQVQEPLVAAFCEHGVPEGMLMDHRHAVVARTQCGRDDEAVAVADAARHWAALERGEASADAKVERFHGELQPALARRRVLVPDVQLWLDQFRWEHNHVRPHEALSMQTPASRWRPSVRRYDASPLRWEYPAGARVLKVDS